MKTENTLENKVAFFGNYYGAKIKHTLTTRWDKLKFGKNINEGHYLELTPLSQISDENAIEVAEMLIHRNFEIYNQKLGEESNAIKAFFDPDENDNYYLYKDLSFGGESYVANYFELPKVYDYLRSKGYAVPWRDLSVDDLVSYGWVKLKSE